MHKNPSKNKKPPAGTPEAKGLQIDYTYHKNEVRYLRGIIEEQRDIIRHLFFNEPTEFQYIHPYDLAEMLEDKTVNKILTITRYLTPDIVKEDIVIDEQRYRQTTNIPYRTKKYG